MMRVWRQLLVLLISVALSTRAAGQAVKIYDRLDKQRDVTITTPALGHFLRYNGTKWVNQIITEITTTDLNVSSFSIGGVTVTTSGTELNYVDGVTSAIQPQLDAKQPLDADLTDLSDGSLTGSKVGTGINGDNVTSGTLADARIASTITRDSEAAAAYQPIPGTPTVRGMVKDVYLAVRTDSPAAATGTPEDPFDASTQVKFDAVMAAVPANSIIHILPGTYLTKGITPKSGWRIYSSPETTWKLDVLSTITNSNKKISILGAESTALVSDIVVEGGTWDCNLQNQTITQMAAQAINIIGDNITVKNIKAINWGSTKLSSECFVVGVFSNGTTYGQVHKNVVFDGIEITQPAAVTHVGTSSPMNPCGGQNVVSGSALSNGWFDGVTVRNCWVHDFNTADAVSYACLNIGGWVRGLHIHDNRFQNLGGNPGNTVFPIYMDTGSGLDVVIENNIFDNTVHGVYTNGGATYVRQRWAIRNNHFLSLANNSGSCVNLSIESAMSDVKINGNTCRSPGQSGSAILVGTATNVAITRNSVNGYSATFPIFLQTGATVSEFFSNTKTDGTPISISGQPNILNLGASGELTTKQLTLGVAGTSVGSLDFKNATSGTITMSPPTGALGTVAVTLPNASTTMPIFGQQMTFSGPTAARTVTLPDANFTAARTDAANTFTGNQTFGTVVATTLTGAGGGVTLVASGFDGNLATTDDTIQEVAQKLDDLVVSGPSDTAFASSWNGVTTVAPSKNSVYDWAHIGDTDDDGKPDVLDLGTAGLVRSTSGGVISSAELSGDVVTAGSNVATIQANSVALAADTTGNYVASVATTAPLTGGAAGSEGGTLTVALDQTAAFDFTGTLTLDSDALRIRDTDASHQLIITPGSNLTANRVFTLTTGDAARTLTMTGDASITGTNTGDQTITLTGDVTGTGTGSFAATIADNSVDGTDIALGSDAQGDVMYYNGTDWVRLAAGTSGQFLQTQGAGANPLWAASAGSGTVTSVAQTFTGGLISVAGSPITTSGTLALTIAGTSGGIPYFSSAAGWASSAALAANALVIGGGAGAAPATTATGTGVLTALGNTANAAGGVATVDGTKTLTNTTFDTAGTGNSFSINGVAATANTGTGSVARATSPTFVTPVLGAATATSINGAGITGTATVTVSQATTLNRQSSTGLPVELSFACSDETTAITTGTGKVTYRAPYAFTITAVRASVTTAPVGSTIIIDINDSGTSIMTTTKLSIDASEKTSTTAASAAAITDTAIADDAEIGIDFDQVGSSTAGAGVKVTILGYR